MCALMFYRCFLCSVVSLSLSQAQIGLITRFCGDVAALVRVKSVCPSCPRATGVEPEALYRSYCLTHTYSWLRGLSRWISDVQPSAAPAVAFTAPSGFVKYIPTRHAILCDWMETQTRNRAILSQKCYRSCSTLVFYRIFKYVLSNRWFKNFL